MTQVEERDGRLPAGDPRFLAILDEIREMHCRKGADYGTDRDMFANIRASERFGVQAWKGAILRANDKMARLETFCIKGTLANEGVEDSMLDLANYMIIALRLYREAYDIEPLHAPTDWCSCRWWRRTMGLNS